MNDLIFSGSTGFIGTNLKKTAEINGYKIFEITRTEVISPAANPVEHKNDPIIISEALKNAYKPIFINLAALFQSNHTPQNISPLVRSNIEFSTIIFEVAAIIGSSGILHFGTSWQFSNTGETDPTNLYAATKVASESILKFYAKNYKIPSATIVMYDTYGPNDNRKKLIPLILESSKNRESFMMGHGRNPINLSFITDVCDAIMRAVEAIEKQPKGSHCRWAIRNVETYLVFEVVELIIKKIDPDLKVEFAEPSQGSQPKSLDESIMVVPHWKPLITLQNGLKITFESEKK